MPKRTLRKSYITDILKLDSVDDLQPMTFADIEDLVDYEPDNAKLLINDLLIELLDETANGDYEEDEDEPATNAAEAA